MSSSLILFITQAHSQINVSGCPTHTTDTDLAALSHWLRLCILTGLSILTDWDYGYWTGSPPTLTETMDIELALHPQWLRKKTLSVLNSGIFHLYSWAHLSFHPVSDHISHFTGNVPESKDSQGEWPHHLSSAKWCTWDKQHVTNTTLCVNPGSLLCRQTCSGQHGGRNHICSEMKSWLQCTLHESQHNPTMAVDGRHPPLAYPALTAQECVQKECCLPTGIEPSASLISDSIGLYKSDELNASRIVSQCSLLYRCHSYSHTSKWHEWSEYLVMYANLYSINHTYHMTPSSSSALPNNVGVHSSPQVWVPVLCTNSTHYIFSFHSLRPSSIFSPCLPLPHLLLIFSVVTVFSAVPLLI